MSRGSMVAGLTLLLAGCGGAPLDQAQTTRVAGLLREEFAPATPPLTVASWRTEAGAACGELEAPASLRDQQSTIRYVEVDGHLSLERHFLTADPATALIAAEGEALFDNMWAQHCAPAAPIGRRLAGWFTWGAGNKPDTPITNAYTAELLNAAKSR